MTRQKTAPAVDRGKDKGAGAFLSDPSIAQNAAQDKQLAIYHLARFQAGGTDDDLAKARETWPDLPEKRSQVTTWLKARPDLAEAVAKVDPDGPPPAEGDWQIYTLADAYAPRPPVEYVVAGLLPLPSLSIVYAPPGCFKTMLLADLAVCVSAGLPWLPPMPGEGKGNVQRATMQLPTLWADFDNGPRTMHERIEAVARARDLPETTPLYYASMPNPWLDASNFASVAQLAGRVQRLGARLVVVDNLRDVAGGVDENSAAMGDVMSNFRRLAEDTGAAVVIIHHQRKGNGFPGRSGDTLRGHSSIEAALDLALLVEREEHADAVTIKATKTRGADVLPFGAIFAYDWRPGTTDLEKVQFYGRAIEDLTSDAAIKRAILEIVKAEPEIKKGDLVKSLQEVTTATRGRVTVLIDTLASDGRLVVKPGSHNAKLYELPKTEEWREVSLV